jgi:Skp family chaperone for outer membrane proteins
MRKNYFSLVVLASIIVLSSCSSKSSFDSDVRKMADYRCKVQQLEAKDPSDQKVQKELEDVKKEMSAYREKMSKKYEDKKDDKAMNEKANKIMDEVMSKCK